MRKGKGKAMYKTVYEKSDLLSVEDMAKEAGVHEQTIRKYIKGKAANGLTIEVEKLGTAAFTTRANFEKWKKEYTAWKAARDEKKKQRLK